MYVIGVTGAVASGKSIVARQLRRRGAKVLDADRIGHAVLRLAEVKRLLHARWGDQIFTGATGEEPRSAAELGRIDRSAVARRVFGSSGERPDELAFLEQVTHPRIDACMHQQLARWRAAGRVPAAVLDAPVLYKAGWDRHCDRILYVDAPWDVRAARAAERGWTVEQLEARQAQQPSLEFQRSRADRVIDNGGSLAATVEQIDTFWDQLMSDPEE